MDEQETTPTPPATSSTVAPAKSSNKTLYIVIGVLGAMALLVVLGSAVTHFTGERMVERAIELSSGGDVDIDIDKSGAGTVKISSDDGAEIEYSAGGNVAIPATWPDDMPVLDDATVSYVGSSNPATGEAGSVVMFQTEKSLEEVSAYYEQALADNGWTVESTVRTGDAVMFAGTKDTRSVSLYVTSSDPGTTSVTLSIGG